MTITELYEQILSEFYKKPGAEQLLEEPVTVTVSSEPERTLRPEGDPPSTVARPEYCVIAMLGGETGGTYGEAYAEAGIIADSLKAEVEDIPGKEIFCGTLKEALEIAPTENGISPITVSALNAAMSRLNLCSGVFQEGEEFHAMYADALCRYVTEHYGRDNIVLVGYDGYLVKRFMDEKLGFWTLDLDPDNVSQDRFDHIVVNGAKLNRESGFAWGKIFIVTGSSLCNGTIIPYLNSGKELLFYGITCAGTAGLLNLSWFSPENA